MDAYSTDTIAIPPLAPMPKDHKRTQGQVPATRPVCLCTESINVRPSDILSDILAPIAREEGRTVESESTEESLYYVAEANKRLKEENNQTEETGVNVGSMDMEALYPCIEVEKSARIVGELVENTKVQIENVDYNLAVRFIASNSSQSQIEKWG